jgi:hypothetical protein
VRLLHLEIDFENADWQAEYDAEKAEDTSRKIIIKRTKRNEISNFALGIQFCLFFTKRE